MDAVSAYNLGLDNFNAKNYREALDCFKRVIELDSAGFEVPLILAYINRGKSYLNLGRYNNALRDLYKALDIANYEQPEYIASIHWDLGVTYQKAGRYEEAIHNLLIPAKAFLSSGDEEHYTNYVMVCLNLVGLKGMMLNGEIMTDCDKNTRDKLVKSIDEVYPAGRLYIGKFADQR